MTKRRKVVGEGDGKNEGVKWTGKKSGAGVWDGEEGCCWWMVHEGARVNRERDRKESAGQWKLPRRKATETVGETWLRQR